MKKRLAIFLVLAMLSVTYSAMAEAFDGFDVIVALARPGELEAVIISLDDETSYEVNWTAAAAALRSRTIRSVSMTGTRRSGIRLGRSLDSARL